MKVLSILSITFCMKSFATTAPFDIYDSGGNQISSFTTEDLVMVSSTPAVDWSSVSYKAAPKSTWGTYKFDDHWTLFNLAKFSKKMTGSTAEGYQIKSLFQTKITDTVPGDGLTLVKNILTLESTLAKQTIPVSSVNTFSFDPLTITDKTSINFSDILSQYNGSYPKNISFMTVLNSFTTNSTPNTSIPFTASFSINYAALSSNTQQDLSIYFNNNQKQSGIITIKKS